MSLILAAEALKIRGLTPAERVVLICLADCRNNATGQCNPSRAYIADACEVSIETVKRSLASLEAKGHIRRQACFREDGSRSASNYDVLPGAPALMGGSRNYEPESNRGMGGSNSTLPRGQIDPYLGSPVTPLKNQELNQEVNNPLNISDKLTPPLGFDAFWSAYPRKVGKPLAKKSFDRAVQSGSPPAAIIAAAEAYAERWRQTATDPAFIPHPSTWLNQERFNDDPHAAIPDARPTRPANSPFDEMARGFARAAGSDEPKPDPVDIF